MGRKQNINIGVLKMRYSKGKTSQAENARHFGVSKQAIAYWFNKLGLASRPKLKKNINQNMRVA